MSVNQIQNETLGIRSDYPFTCPLVIESIHEPWWKHLLNGISETINPPKFPPLPEFPPPQPGLIEYPNPNVPTLSRVWWLGIPETLKVIIASRAFPALSKYPPAQPGVVELPELNIRTLNIPWWLGILETLRLVLELRGLPPLKLTSRPLNIKGIWGGFSYRRQGLALTTVAHLFLVLMIFGFQGGEAEARNNGSVTLIIPIDISPYLAQLQMPAKNEPGKSGGGGGGGANSPLPASIGKLPRFSLEPQLAPPSPIIRNEDPELSVEPTVRVQPELSFQQLNLSVFGDPFGAKGPPAAGTGTGGGIGSGRGTGVGSGRGSGVGPGSGGGIGGGVYRIGGGVTSPRLLQKIEPEYSEEARKAKYQGTVMLAVEVWEDGIAHNIRIIRSLGLGLDEKAVEAVRLWKFSPGKKDGKPVRVAAQIQVSFRLL